MNAIADNQTPLTKNPTGFYSDFTDGRENVSMSFLLTLFKESRTGIDTFQKLIELPCMFVIWLNGEKHIVRFIDGGIWTLYSFKGYALEDIDNFKAYQLHFYHAVE